MMNAELCSECGSPATIHFIQVVGARSICVHLCDDCARKKGIMDEKGHLRIQCLDDKMAFKSSSSVAVCPCCGLTATEFQKEGRLSCPQCYTTFEASILAMLADSQDITHCVHRGKTPLSTSEKKQPFSSVEVKLEKEQRLEALSADLELAIIEERYEDAQQLKSEIHKLNHSVSH